MLKRKSKRVLSIVLAVAMIVGLFPIAAFADGGGETSVAATSLPTAGEDGVITLTEDVTLTAPFTVAQNEKVIIDLNGKKIDAGTNQISLASGSELIIKDSSNGTGEILASGQTKADTGLFLVDNATLTLNGGKFNAANNNYGVYASNGGKVIVNDGTFTAGYAPLAGNNTTGDMKFEVNGGTLTANYGPAIYMPGQVNLTITNGTLNGGISLRMGQVNISGGTINAPTTNIDAVKDYYDYSGNAWLADALYVFNGTYTSENEKYGNSLDLNITGGTFNCTNDQGSAIAIYDLGKVAQSSDVSISGSAVLHSTAEGRSVYQVLSLKDIGVDSPAEGFNNSEYVGKVQSSITGGTFSSDVSTYVPNGYICKQNAENEKWTVSGISSGQMVVRPESPAEGKVEATLDGVYSGASTDIKDEVNSGESNEGSNIGANGVVVNIAKNDAPTTTSATLNVTQAAADSLASAPALTVKTDVGDVQLDAQALDKVAQATDDVAITIEKKDSTDLSAKALYTVEVKSGDENLLPENAANNGTVTITVAKPDSVENPQAWYVVGEDSSLVYVEKLAANETTDNKIAITINHLSSIALTDGNPKNQSVATVTGSNGELVGHYADLQEAITAAKGNGTVTLVNSVNLTDGVEVEGTVTLDLNGYTITNDDNWTKDTSVDYLLAVKRSGNLTINDSSANKTGAIISTNDKIAVAVKLTIKDETGEGDAATLTVNGGTLKAPFYGISGNGMRHNTKLTIKGGTIEGTKGTGIYQPQDGTVTINGGTITGLTGIEIRSGKLDVSGGTFISTAKKYEAVKNDSGTTVTGAAIAVSQHTTGKTITVTVDGGTFEGPKSFVETDVQKVPVGESSATINKGTFDGEVSSAHFTNFVKGGQFSAPVDTDLLNDSLKAQLQSTSNTTAPYSYYTSVQAAVNAAAAGDAITILVNTNENVTVSKPVTIVAGAGVTQTGTISAGNGYDVTVDENGNIVIVKEPEYNGKYSYEIFTKVGENGTISVDRYATEGDNVTITVSPDEAYLLDELTVTANGKEVEVKDNGDGTYTFKMPSADAKIVVTFAEDPDWEPAPEMPFTDVNENDWFYDVVLYAYDNGLMTGVSATEFAPNQTTTRGMIVSMLARLEGVTSAEDAGFADVAANDWYATAVNWAASVGVVNGYEDNTFRPNAPITREQMAAILYNYADYKGYDVSARADLSDYADAADVSSWAEDVLAWANAEGLINGMTATTIDPQGATTRAQTAAMFERFLTAHEA